MVAKVGTRTGKSVANDRKAKRNCFLAFYLRISFCESIATIGAGVLLDPIFGFKPI